ncbi:aminoglycoside phosphotransferase [Paenibacillus psychroresistens]|uniref:Aminoglycoside phosphotransferase n=1 Tax=Paenibacillus psychroresistens TaxID=1778678 RepID=A0A6B8RTH1_9BACL|nr:phosphotransferase [Paenibacillus psychroresistens]QGQ99187.1 aminoglycoside phosphotransferase [Paenibacillus psychroresistens]
MSLFPVAYSLLSKQALLSHIKDNYDVHEPLTLKYFLRGMNDTYILETGSCKYMFRVYRADRRNKSEIAFELDLLNYLNQNDVCVSIPITKIDGTLINEFFVTEGVKYGVMFSYAEGNERPIRTVEDSFLFGKSVALIHKVTDNFSSKHVRGNLNFDHLIENPLNIIKLHMDHRQEDFNCIYEIIIKLKEQLVMKIEEGLDWGVCHGDLHGNTNVAFTDNGKLTHYDFDISGYGWRSYDIAEFRLAREIHSRHNKDEVERLWEAFLNGYREVRDLSENDVQVVSIFVALRQLWLFGLCFSESELIGGADFGDRFIDSKMEYFRKLIY